ncbi:hypothetical protein [Bacteriovorax sp. Seq25_V]|uniref:hypothetical protein n=1 Tax=Bacteriovorax sp. Seq25_V TaxID=1201288 RepID=UPI000389ED01|nr:hypothetical protein [Bacteriovorax sp. Seq25_V]EQC45453.1 hypothetical protein M900_2166 [Bacteriovorax sp. Seq25_V]
MKTLIVFIFLITHIQLANAGTESVVGDYALSECQQLSGEEKSKCEAELESNKLAYQNQKEQVNNIEKIGNETLDSNTMSGGIAVAATAAIELDILGSLGIGISFEGSCYSCKFGTAVSLLAFLYQKNRHDKYDGLFKNAKEKLRVLYEKTHENKNDIQYQVLLSEIEAFELIYKAAKEKAGAHKNLKTIFTLVQAAAAVEVVICSFPMSGCSPVPPAITLATATISASAEGKAQARTEGKADIAKKGLDITRALAAKFHLQYQEGDEGELSVADSEIAVPQGEEIENKLVTTTSPSVESTAMNGGKRSSSKASTGSTAKNKSNSQSSSSNLSYKTSGLCLSSESKLVKCNTLSASSGFKTMPLTKSSKLGTQVSNKVGFDKARGAMDDAFKGDYSKLQAYATDGQYRLTKKVVGKLLDKALDSKTLDSKARNYVEKAKAGFTDKERDDFIKEFSSPGLLAANKSLFKNDIIEATNETKQASPSLLYSGSSKNLNKMNGPSKDKENDSLEKIIGENSFFANLDESGQTISGRSSSDFETSKNSVDYSDYNIFYTNEINKQKDVNLFKVITHRYQSHLVLKRLGVD